MKKIVSYFLESNIYIKLLPFLVLYLLIIKLWVLPTEFAGDEVRYLMFAKNLLNGFYSPPKPDFNLWNGPGYPLFLAPFLALGVPIFTIRLVNGLLLYFSLIVIYKTILIYSPQKVALFSAIAIGCYFPAFQMLRSMLTETLSWFLISLLCYSFIKYYKSSTFSWKSLILSAFIIAYLAMVKVIFGYVIVTILLLSLVLYLFRKFRTSARKSIIVFSLSIILCLPYLIYTYSLTNKLFYWTNSGSMSLYTMSTPNVGELGDWSSTQELQLNPNHKIFLDSIAQFNSLEREQAFKMAAIKNIKNHPQKYLTNYISNIGRLFFEYPYSNKKEDVNTLFYIFPAAFAIVFVTIALLISLLYIKLIPQELIILFLFFLIYLFGSSLVSTYSRMFNITLPFWVLFISYVFSNIITFKFKQEQNNTV